MVFIKSQSNNAILKTGIILLLVLFFLPFITFAQTIDTPLPPEFAQADLVSDSTDDTSTTDIYTPLVTPPYEPVDFTPLQQESTTVENLTVVSSPQNPKAYDDVTITLQSFSFDLDRSEVIWRVNGKTELSGTGEKSFGFTTGGLGKESVVSVEVTTNDGNYVKKVLSFIPAEVDLIWDANTYTPPFYSGKALFTIESSVTIVAFPNFIYGGKRLDPNNLIYTWSQNGSVVSGASGYGKNVFVFNTTPITRPTTIKVVAKSMGGSLSAERSVFFDPSNSQPKIAIYENSPLFGILYNNKIQKETSLTGKEMKFVAIPYFFSVTNRNDSTLKYRWQMNKQDITGNNSGNILFRNADSKEGASAIDVFVKSLSKTFQSAESSFSLKFSPNGQATFGL